VNGKIMSLADSAFAGKARLIEIFGTWCPNCKDASSFMAELDETYRDRGLSILGLAFEMTGDLERDANQVKIYSKANNIRFPILVAGLADKAKASESFPALDSVRSFPTFIFMNAEGDVEAIYQGYSGPATGEAHIRLKESFRKIIERLIDEPVKSDATAG
jgi:thiol-disulfide isomerase/thioredoxin